MVDFHWAGDFENTDELLNYILSLLSDIDARLSAIEEVI